VVRADWLLLITAMIWGCAFVAQRSGMNYMGPFTFTGVRFMLGACALMPLVAWRRHHGVSIQITSVSAGMDFLRKSLLLGGVLFCGAGLQQIGMVHTTAGKGGFITGLYVILVPVFGLFFGRRPGWSIWAASVLATLGMYFLSITDRFTMGTGDLWVLASAFFWALHVMIIGWLSPQMDTIQLACAQFWVCSVLSLITAGFVETVSFAAVIKGAVPLLYGGLLSVGIAFTLQVVAQKNAPPAHAAIIMSLETVFAAMAGWLILKEPLTLRAMTGCVLMLAGMLIAQLWPAPSRP
jgi:drug/metabolite transporter (DMT)-like permease